MPKFMTIMQIAKKRKTDFRTALGIAFVDAIFIPGMIVPSPSDVTQETLTALIDQMCDTAIHRYAKCIFAFPIEGDVSDFSFVETMSVLRITSLSLNEKYRNLCASLGNIDDSGLINGVDPIQWYLSNYRVTTTGTVGETGSGTSSVNTDITTTRHRNIGTLDEGTSGETSPTLRPVSQSKPVDFSSNNAGDTDTISGDAESNNTHTVSSSTTTYNTLKEGYYNTGNKTTILEDIQDLARNAPFFPKWLDEVMTSIIIPVYTSTFPVSKPGIF